MKIENGKVVQIHYTLKNDAGTVIDSSEGKETLGYIHGAGNIIPGLEKALEGKGAGDKVDTSIAPAEAYGEKRDELVQKVPLSAFQDSAQVKVGAMFQLQTEQGPISATVIEVGADSVQLDMNHPLAGETLHFAVEVKEVRDATKEELDHGHVHGEGGHHH